MPSAVDDKKSESPEQESLGDMFVVASIPEVTIIAKLVSHPTQIIIRDQLIGSAPAVGFFKSNPISAIISVTHAAINNTRFKPFHRQIIFAASATSVAFVAS